MSERKSVTREELLAAIRPLFDGPESVHLDRLGWWDGDILAVTPRDLAGRIFDALPATPAASGDVDAAWEALAHEIGSNLYFGDMVRRHRAAIEAAIRAESAGTLDVGRLARALDNLPPLPYGALNEKCIREATHLPTAKEWAAYIAAEYARLGEDADKPS